LFGVLKTSNLPGQELGHRSGQLSDRAGSPAEIESVFLPGNLQKPVILVNDLDSKNDQIRQIHLSFSALRNTGMDGDSSRSSVDE
jgi:hypothetical protein